MIEPITVLLAVHVKVPVSFLRREEMVRFDVTEINPSSSATAGSALTLILSPSSGGDQVKEGAGTPVAVQVKVTMSPSVSTTIMSATGTVTFTGSERK